MHLLPALKNWLREALLLNPSDLTPTPLAVYLSKVDLFNKDSGTLWQLLWGNLAKMSPICNEYVQAVKLGATVSKKRIWELIMDRVTCASERTVKNAVDALVNLIIKTPLKKILFDVTYKGNAVESITRRKDEVNHAVLAYYIFQYAEQQNRRDLSVSELVDTTSPTSLATVFGLSARDIEPTLRRLQNNYQLIDAQLSMGLDNVIVRKDMSSLEVFKFTL